MWSSKVCYLEKDNNNSNKEALKLNLYLRCGVQIVNSEKSWNRFKQIVNSKQKQKIESLHDTSNVYQTKIRTQLT